MKLDMKRFHLNSIFIFNTRKLGAAIKIINTTLAFLKISVFSSLVLDPLLKTKKLICLFNRQQSKDLTHVRRPVLSMRYNPLS